MSTTDILKPLPYVHVFCFKLLNQRMLQQLRVVRPFLNVLGEAREGRGQGGGRNDREEMEARKE